LYSGVLRCWIATLREPQGEHDAGKHTAHPGIKIDTNVAVWIAYDTRMSFVNTPAQSRGRTKFIVISLLILTLVAAGLAIFVKYHWPFREEAVRARLAGNISAEIRIGAFRQRFFPPGCVAENVIFTGNGSGPPLISIRRLTISTNLAGLVRHRVTTVRAEGIHLVLGRSDFARARASKEKLSVDKLVADDAEVEVSQGANHSPLKFLFHVFQLQNLGGIGATKFIAVFDNPLPAGLIRTSGQFGPWKGRSPASTAVTGEYSLENADLGVFKTIAGRVSSNGKFRGSFAEIEIEGSTSTPELQISRTHHGVPLQTRFSATVNATNGEARLNAVRANFGRDIISAQGSIARRSGGKRTAVLDLHCERGRVEDTFYPFIHSPKSPLRGDIAFDMHASIPSGPGSFLTKIDLSSSFRMWNAEFTNPQTEIRLSKVSERPHQKEPDELAARLDGRVTVSSGVAHFSNLSVEDQGASAWFNGNYNLLDNRVSLRGSLKTEASLTKTTSGIKSIFAKVLEPLFKIRPHQTVVPVKIGGTFQHPSFGLDMSSKM
jgi:hypothetical protein